MTDESERSIPVAGAAGDPASSPPGTRTAQPPTLDRTAPVGSRVPSQPVAPTAVTPTAGASDRVARDARADDRSHVLERETRDRTPRRRRWPFVVVIVLLVLMLGAAVFAAVHLHGTSQAWNERSERYLGEARTLGDELAATRAELAGRQAELEAVRAQLATAQSRIVELADEKAQLGDDREVQQQIVDYQERVTEAAGRVALALDQCVQGQDQLIGYMQNAEAYDPAELDQYRSDVQALCQTATEANTSLQNELAR